MFFSVYFTPGYFRSGYWGTTVPLYALIAKISLVPRLFVLDIAASVALDATPMIAPALDQKTALDPAMIAALTLEPLS